MRRAYDAIVIGAGVMGASVAFHLARAGAGRIAIVERRAVCSGNTRKSGAIVRMHYTNEHETRLALASLPYFRHWAELVGGTSGFTRTGFLLLVGPENEARLRRNVERLRSLGVNTRAIGPDELREVQPTLDPTGVAAAAYEPDSGHADPLATTRSLIERACSLGAEVFEETPVTAIRVASGRVVGVDTAYGPTDAPVVVCAANTWSPGLLRTAGVELPVTPRRAQVAYFRRPAALAGRHHVVLDTTSAMYTRPNGPDEVLGGAAEVTGETPTDPDALAETLDGEFPAAVRERLGRRIPALARAPFVWGHAGMYDMSPDTRAILDRAPGVDGLYLAAGFSGTGFKKAPAVGLGLSELILTGRSTSVDLAPFRFGRFADGAHLHGVDEYVLPRSWGHGF